MLFVAANFDPLTAGADEIFQRGIQIDLVTHLVKISHLQIGATANRAAIGLQGPQDQLQQRGLACTVGANQAHLVAAQYCAREVFHNRFVAKRFRYIGQLCNDLALVAAVFAGVNIQLDAAQRFTPCLAIGAQGLQPFDTALAAGATCLHTFTNPDFFLGQQFVSLGVDHGFLLQLLFLLEQVLGKVSRVRLQLSAIQFYDACRNPVQKGPVVGNRHDAALEVNQQIF